MFEIWQTKNPNTIINEQRLLNQKRAIEKNKLLSQIECQQIASKIDAINNDSNNDEESQQADAMMTVQATEAERERVESENNSLTNGQREMKSVMIEYMAKYSNHEERPTIRKIPLNKEAQETIMAVNTVLRTIPTKDLEELNALLFAGAKIVEERLMPDQQNSRRTEIAPWKRRIIKKIEMLRKEVNQLKAAIEKKGRIPPRVRRKYEPDINGLQHAFETAKQRLVATSHKLKRYEARNEQHRINKMFRECPRKVYYELNNKNKEALTLSESHKEEIRQYWEHLWGTSVKHNEKSVWMNDAEKDCEVIRDQTNISITVEDIKTKITNMSNWKAPGPDRIHVFWLKKFTTLHERLANLFNTLINNVDSMPGWLVFGRTQLIEKDKNKGPTPQNFRPITCLTTMWKLLSGIISNKILRHLKENQVLCYEQKGIRPSCRGTKDQLAIDRSITKDNKRRHTNLAMAWIDYRKAFDSVPHSWLIKCMNMYKINDGIKTLIMKSMSLWKTQVMCDKQAIGQIKIERGLFQGDSLSPLLFCIAINPLSTILHKAGKEYAVASGEKINHLLYMDDLKLFSKKEEDLNTLVNTVQIFSQDIRMEFGFDKCAMIVVRRGKTVHSKGIEIEGSLIPDISDESQSYKYLGIPQQHTNIEEKAKHKATAEYKRRLKQILKSKLNAKNKIEAINSYAIPVINYTAGVVKWTVAETSELNRTTRKILNMYHALHPRADVDRLYLPRKFGGRGLKNISDTIEAEDRGLSHYIWQNTTDPLLAIAKKEDIYKQRSESPEIWKEKVIEERRKVWKEKPLHGQYPKEMEQRTSTEHCFGWMKQVQLKIETEALLTAAQDQALSTKAHKALIMKTTKDALCRMCKEKNETVAHLLAGCSKLSLNEYLRRHNEVARLLHKNICDDFGIPTTKRYWMHEPTAVTETEDVKILWDFEIQTDHHITARRPDIIVVDKKKKETLIIDVAVPEDRNICDKEKEKITKYQDLRLEIKKLWNTKAKVVPVVIGSLGAHTSKLNEYIHQIPGTHHLPSLVKAALLGSAHILRKVLDLPESW
jgi:hypothetical protein